jgi:hypothetical protein
VHAPRSRQNLSKSYDKLKDYSEKYIKPYILGRNGSIRPPELDYCVEDVFPTSFNQELQALVDDSQLISKVRQTGRNESSGWGGSSQEDQEPEDTTRTLSETVVNASNNVVEDGSGLVHIDNLIGSGNEASSHISSPPPMAKGDGLLVADAYMGDINGETTNEKTVRSGPKSHKSITKLKSVSKPPVAERAPFVSGSSASAAAKSATKSATKSSVSGKSKSVPSNASSAALSKIQAAEEHLKE